MTRQQLKSDSNNWRHQRKEKELNNSIDRWTVNKFLISQFVCEVLFRVVYFTATEVRIDACEQCYTWQGAPDRVPWALIHLGYQPVQRADRPTKHHTCRLPGMYDPPKTEIVDNCYMSFFLVNITSCVAVCFSPIYIRLFMFISSRKRRTTWSNAPPLPRASVVQGYMVLVALPVWELSTHSVSTPNCNGAFTPTNTDKNDFYMIVWRCSYCTETPMPLNTVAIVSVSISVSVNTP